mmetsp:Transcript_1199/g.2627  ORF Transcript_1199/g.2627 Transcript_1199/m.2627 type:complete len:232 (+) Transcript_1199:415-1110(+)
MSSVLPCVRMPTIYSAPPPASWRLELECRDAVRLHPRGRQVMPPCHGPSHAPGARRRRPAPTARQDPRSTGNSTSTRRTRTPAPPPCPPPPPRAPRSSATRRRARTVGRRTCPVPSPAPSRPAARTTSLRAVRRRRHVPGRRRGRTRSRPAPSRVRCGAARRGRRRRRWRGPRAPRRRRSGGACGRRRRRRRAAGGRLSPPSTAPAGVCAHRYTTCVGCRWDRGDSARGRR